MSAAASSLRATFRVALEREYHVSAGHGRGTEVDSVLFTDGSGDGEVPAVRYGHAILSQAVFDLLQAGALGERWRRCSRSGAIDPEYCPAGADPCPVCRVFGSPAHPSPWTFSTLHPEKPREDNRRRARVLSRTRVDPRTRRAAEGALFSQELGAPLAFTFHAERPGTGDGEEARDELALLLAAARCVAGIGAGRRRGRGECRIALAELDGVEPDLNRFLDRFAEAWLGEAPRAAAPSAEGRTAVPAARVSPTVWTRPEPTARWLEVPLVLRLREPVVAGGRPLTGNLLPGEPYLAGTLLLGALAGHALRGGAAADDTFLRVFRSGRACFPDLLPAFEVGGDYLPTLPAPRDLLTCPLHPEHGVWSWLAHSGPEPLRTCPKCGGDEVKLRRLKRFVAPGVDGGGKPAPRELDQTLREETKIQMDPHTGRVAGESLYHRETIPAGTLLAGTLRLLPDALDELRALGVPLGDSGSIELRLGKRSRRGYGLATLAWGAAAGADAAETARGRTRARAERLLARSPAVVPLVLGSRLLLRDGLGRALQSLTPKALGLPGAGACDVGWEPVGGFWRHVGLPRRQEAALAAGSVLRLDASRLDAASRKALADRLVELAHGAPCGERAAEGFGRVAVAPFPYGWVEEFAGEGDWNAPTPLPLPQALRPAHAGSDDPPGRRLDVEREKEYTDDLARVDFSTHSQEWRAVARTLYALAGEEHVRITTKLETGDKDALRRMLDRSGRVQEDRSFLLHKQGKEAWSVVKQLIKKAADPGLDEQVRAAQTRALADILAGLAHPARKQDEQAKKEKKEAAR